MQASLRKSAVSIAAKENQSDTRKILLAGTNLRIFEAVLLLTMLKFIGKIIYWKFTGKILDPEQRVMEGEGRVASSPSFCLIFNPAWLHLKISHNIIPSFPRSLLNKTCQSNVEKMVLFFFFLRVHLIHSYKVCADRLVLHFQYHPKKHSISQRGFLRNQVVTILLLILMPLFVMLRPRTAASRAAKAPV